MMRALKLMMMMPKARRSLFDRTRSRSSPPGNWVNKLAIPPAVKTKPMFSADQP
jgi:hypothetical protein